MTLCSHSLRAIGATALLLAIGCTTTPESEFYMLSPVSQAPNIAFAGNADLSIGVGPVQIPDYLDRPQLVTQTSSNRLQVDEFHRWGGSLNSNLLRVVAQNLSALTGTDNVVVYPWEDPVDPKYLVQLSVLDFGGSLGGDVVLDVQWLVSSNDRRKTLASGRSQITEVARGPDYVALVAAQSRALGKLSEEIGGEILRLSRGG
jgi:uncharacterized lipoprotein YmbA